MSTTRKALVAAGVHLHAQARILQLTWSWADRAVLECGLPCVRLPPASCESARGNNRSFFGLGYVFPRGYCSINCRGNEVDGAVSEIQHACKAITRLCQRSRGGLTVAEVPAGAATDTKPSATRRIDPRAVPVMAGKRAPDRPATVGKADFTSLEKNTGATHFDATRSTVVSRSMFTDEFRNPDGTCTIPGYRGK
ncbi:hypothetical protein [Amycolatopsis sp. cmx-4-68]|uniref:hypothetical protein n=1 Tax=Amycolatopsis sp. cmx-4-68 TaxID=2790938 RepID=UPI00397C8998